MLKIAVAGAGHGGLTAAIRLAQNGCDVTVIEAKAEEALGHDWHDSMQAGTFEFCGLPTPEDAFTPYVKARQKNPAQTVELRTDPSPSKTVVYIDRKTLIRYLIAEAKAAGVKFRFGTEVTGPVSNGGRVSGLFLRQEHRLGVLDADLVIDAAGMDSPVRRNLPESAGIRRELGPEETYFVYRAYFNGAGEPPEHSYNIVFFHTGLPGLDWVIDRDGVADVLVGGIGADITDRIGPALADFRSRYPFVGETLLRGGNGVYKIPLRRTLPLFVAEGYAAVGDSASMVEPMNGSGISLSMKAGRILADTVLHAGDRAAETARLWRYQYIYQRALGEKYLKDDILKSMLGTLTPADMDYLFERGVLTAKEMLGADAPVNAEYLLGKASLLGRPALTRAFLRAAGRLMRIKRVCALMPERYDREAIEIWAKQYEEL